MRIQEITRRAIVAVIISLLITVTYISIDASILTVRDGQEYTDMFLDGQIYEQEIMLNYTPKVYVSILPNYENSNKEIGVKCTLKTDDKNTSKFIPISTYTNKEWTKMAIDTPELNYTGKATLTIEAIGLDQDNYLQTLIITNNLQLDSECKLSKDGVEIPNGRLDSSYLTLKMDTAPMVIVIAFALSFLLGFLRTYFERGIKKYPLAVAVIVLMIVNLILCFQDFQNINTHVSAQYFFTYQSLGFVRRALAGTILELFQIDFTQNAYIIYGISSIIVMLILELAILYDRKHQSEQHYMEKSFWIFLCTPFAVNSFWGYHFFARFDEILIIAFLLCCIVVIKERGVFLIPIISILAILTHEMYVAIFIPFVFCLLLYKWFFTRNKKYIICLVSTSVLSVGIGAYVSFFATPKISFSEAWSHIQSIGDSRLIWDYPLQVDYFMSSKNVMRYGWDTMSQANTIPAAIISLFILLPLILLAILWLKEYYLLQKNLLGRLIVLLFPCTTVGLGLCMYMMCDWGRLFVMFGVAVFFSFFTLWSIDNEGVRAATLKVWNCTCKRYGKPVFALLSVIYLFISTCSGGASSSTLFECVRTLI